MAHSTVLPEHSAVQQPGAPNNSISNRAICGFLHKMLRHRRLHAF